MRRRRGLVRRGGRTVLLRVNPPERPFDIIDQIEGAVGSIRSKPYARPGTEGYYGELYRDANRGAGRKLFSRHGQAPDEIIDTLRREGVFGQDASVDDLWEAIDRANKARAAFRRADNPDRQAENFTKALSRQEKRRCKRAQPVNELAIGSEFRLAGEPFRVTDVDPDTMEVTIADGKKYGRQVLPDGAVIFPDAPCPPKAPRRRPPSPAPTSPAPQEPVGILTLRSRLYANIPGSLNDYLHTANRAAVLSKYRVAGQLLSEIEQEIKERQKSGEDFKALFPMRYDVDGLRAVFEHHLMTTAAEPEPAAVSPPAPARSAPRKKLFAPVRILKGQKRRGGGRSRQRRRLPRATSRPARRYQTGAKYVALRGGSGYRVWRAIGSRLRPLGQFTRKALGRLVAR